MTDSSLRLFAAIPIPPEIRAELERAVQRLRARIPADSESPAPGADGNAARAVRWTNLRGAHLTLKFIGNRPADDAPNLGDALAAAAAACSPFELSLGGLGVFPARGTPRVLWAGVEGATDRLEQLRDAVEQSLVDAGCAPEPRPFSPHLTIARVDARLSRESAIALRRAVDEVGAADAPSAFPVDRVVLYRSTLAPSGAIYAPLHTASLVAIPATM